ncbi:zinc ribbon domain-containing protein [Tissierella carlieri]|uniref:Zinc ribbon domain-containing protein n=1 Tax=Tissierella carlieri TaxID=689904 RepID=A0ABT1SE17_9FIRM|nr:zinc ribbon domain-containing protein [Tissierella carlieri]MCQ4924718.1 zinc ribbon domain-containing protein [Tissierella carlieri]
MLYIILSSIIYLIVKKEEKSHVNSRDEKCRNCGMKINTDFLYCPYCKEEIKKVCECCGRLIDIDWRYCPFCENNEQNTEIIKIIGGKK